MTNENQNNELPWWVNEDPEAKAEAGKYDNPVPSRVFLLQIIEDEGRPMRYEEVLDILDIDDDTDQAEGVSRRLRAMLRDGQLLQDRRRGYVPTSSVDLIKGRVQGHKDGFGFLIPEDKDEEDVFLSHRQMKQVFHGDIVLVQERGRDRRGRKEGGIVEVLERKTTTVVGRFYNEHGVIFVRPEEKRLVHDVMISPKKSMGAKHGQIVLATITEQPSKRSQPVAEVSQVLGEHMAPGMEIDIAIQAYGLPHEWPAGVEDEAHAYGETVTQAAAEEDGRVDLRELPLMTIDGEDARDFDDAVFAKREGRGWRLWVAIADVAHYVSPNSKLDQEAVERGTSVYFPNQVIPMLPEALSNGLCSLNPDVDRLCMVCEMKVNRHGKVSRTKFYNAVMRSHARMTYTKVGKILEEGDSKDGRNLRKEYADIVPYLEDLHDLYRAFRGARTERGSIDFETSEVRFIFGEDRKIEGVEPLVRNDAHKLIEECMIAANVEAARFLARKKMPAPYRVHNGPSDTKLKDLRTFLNELGLKLGGGDDPTPKHYAKLLSSIQERPDVGMIQAIMLRSLSQAVYTVDNDGHFGLGLDHYAHFTSPIRRYPDLMVHRALKHAIKRRKPNTFAFDEEAVEKLSQHCSYTERRADEASWDAIGWLKCEFMMDRVGDVFQGTVTSVTSFGLFVEVDDVKVEGLVHITSLPSDFYHFDSAGHRLTGERTGKTFRLTDRVEIRVVRVDLDDRKIDFELTSVDEQPKTKVRGRKGQTSGKSGAGKPNRGKQTSGGSNNGAKKDNGSRPKRRRSRNKK